MDGAIGINTIRAYVWVWVRELGSLIQEGERERDDDEKRGAAAG